MPVAEQCQAEGVIASQRMLLATQAYPELAARARLHTIQIMGGIAICGEHCIIPEVAEESNNTTLMASTQAAAMGDERGLRYTNLAVKTDMLERVYKIGQTKVHMRMVNGYLEQEDRRLEDIHKNTLKHTVLLGPMFGRTTTELGNNSFAQELYRAGVTDLFDILVCSPTSNKMTDEQKRAYNMFLDTESMSLQWMSADGDDVTLETAFVAGKRTKDSPRHDIEALQAMAAEQGLALPGDGDEMLSQVLLIPKGQTKGVSDVVRWYDEAAGRLTEASLFYGQESNRQDYDAFVVECYERASHFDGMVDAITAQLLREAHTFRRPIDANRRLDKLSEIACLKAAVGDDDISLDIFGGEAKGHIEDVRFFLSIGELDRAEDSFAKAVATAVSGSCPWLKADLDKPSNSNEPSGEGQGRKEKGHCPFCRAPVEVDPCDNVVECWDCMALMIGGKVLWEGNGGTRERERRIKEQHQAKSKKVRRSLFALAA